MTLPSLSWDPEISQNQCVSCHFHFQRPVFSWRYKQRPLHCLVIISMASIKKEQFVARIAYFFTFFLYFLSFFATHQISYWHNPSHEVLLSIIFHSCIQPTFSLSTFYKRRQTKLFVWKKSIKNVLGVIGFLQKVSQVSQKKKKSRNQTISII